MSEDNRQSLILGKWRKRTISENTCREFLCCCHLLSNALETWYKISCRGSRVTVCNSASILHKDEIDNVSKSHSSIQASSSRRLQLLNTNSNILFQTLPKARPLRNPSQLLRPRTLSSTIRSPNIKHQFRRITRISSGFFIRNLQVLNKFFFIPRNGLGIWWEPVLFDPNLRNCGCGIDPTDIIRDTKVETLESVVSLLSV